MWFYPIVLVLVVLAAVGGVAAGGIFTLVLVPIAGLALISGLVYMSLAHTAERRAGTTAGGTDRPLPHRETPAGGHIRTSPERLADARRAEQ
jgi:hypothetical protein